MRHDPSEPHVHLGPVSVDRGLRRQGIGGLLLIRHVAHLDTVGAVGYLETDRPEAVDFYRRFGYAVVGEAKVLGVPCWFMRRPSA
ncbi:GNAT family N-acetyltransferase [Agromyces sp. NPDC056523]|uniref:GNAT family N-acetyltransferase n=1 Tax=Agromyces sp. NPDC056523 TaxID=3345850 RepID=UPI00366F4AF0